MTFGQLQTLFSYETEKRFCIEIQFYVQGSEKFNCCWMGKMWSEEEQGDIYWFGLTPDGSYAFDYPSFEAMVNAPVFDGFSLCQLWDQIVIEEIDGLDPADRLDFYLVRQEDCVP